MRSKTSSGRLFCADRSGAEEVSVRWTLLGKTTEWSEETQNVRVRQDRFNKRTSIGCPFLLKRARDGTRTRGPDLGKVVLHQLSHSRIDCCVGHVCQTHLISYKHELQFVNTKFEIFMQIFRRHTIKKLTPNAVPHKNKNQEI